MNSAEAAEEGPNDSDTDAFFKTGRAERISATWGCVSIDLILKGRNKEPISRRKQQQQQQQSIDRNIIGYEM